MRDDLPPREFSSEPPIDALQSQYGASPRSEVVRVLIRLETDRRRVVNVWAYQEGQDGIEGFLVGQDENLRDLLERRDEGDRIAGHYWAYYVDGVARISSIEAPPW